MEKNLLHDEHGEPTMFTYIAIFGTLLAFGIIWQIANEGWLKFIMDILDSWRNI